MKFSLFGHMERISADQNEKQLYDEFVELCQIADRGGMHAVWTGEHHGMNFTISPNPLLNLVDLANKTENVRLGTGTLVALTASNTSVWVVVWMPGPQVSIYVKWCLRCKAYGLVITSTMASTISSQKPPLLPSRYRTVGHQYGLPPVTQIAMSLPCKMAATYR